MTSLSARLQYALMVIFVFDLISPKKFQITCFAPTNRITINSSTKKKKPISGRVVRASAAEAADSGSIPGRVHMRSQGAQPHPN